MKLYSQKFRWKIVLSGLVLTVVAASLVYSNKLVNTIHSKETEKARQWAETIKKKGELVSVTNKIFIELREKEKKQAQLILDAQLEISRKMDNLDFNVDVDFAQKIISANTTIPIAYLSDNEIAQSINLDTTASKEEINAFIADCRTAGRSRSIEIHEGIFMEFIYGESTELLRLNKESDSLLEAFNAELLDNENLIPLVLINQSTNTVEASNISPNEWEAKGLKDFLSEFPYDPISFDFGDETRLLYYRDSREVLLLTWYPSVQFLLIGLIVLLAYFIFSTYRKAEQNQVWAGMAKETAHQLGTPLSSLMAWMNHLESSGVEETSIQEMNKDLERLSKITERFSKIGSEPKLEYLNLFDTVSNGLAYLKGRLSTKIDLDLINKVDGPLMVKHNVLLMEWVIENMCKNAVDAMDGMGKIKVVLGQSNKEVFIDITDDGKGLSRTQFKTVFQPGFSTKKRGWGLGLTLVKRIIEENHQGKVYVLSSIPNRGTTFRISLHK